MIDFFFFFFFFPKKVRWIPEHWVGIFLSLKINQFHTYLRLIPYSDFKESTCLLQVNFFVTLKRLNVKVTLKSEKANALVLLSLDSNYHVHLKKWLPVGLLETSLFNIEKNLVTLKTYTINGTCRCGQKSWGWTLCMFKLNPLSLRSCCMGQRKWMLRSCSHLQEQKQTTCLSYIIIYFLCIKWIISSVLISNGLYPLFKCFEKQCIDNGWIFFFKRKIYLWKPR